jgi:N-carbamoyl-L-amino-acid hydrolase
MLTVNAQRLWETLMEAAEIGGTPRGGVRRLALSPTDKAARDWFVGQCRDAGCEVTVDGTGSIRALRPGTDNARPPVACGSHLDTQPTGGRFDGALGVVAGLEIVRTLNDAGRRTAAPLMVVDWTNEEGSRFAPSMMGSGVYTGRLDAEYVYRRPDADGILFGEALESIGYLGSAEPVPLGAFFELHIEQGPVLDRSGDTIGVVTHAQGTRWYEITVMGEACHPGTTPMAMRRDALAAAARIAVEVNDIAVRFQPNALGNVGVLRVPEASRNVVPGEAFLTVDLRHPDDVTLSLMDEELRSAIAAIAEQQTVEIGIDNHWHHPPVAFHGRCIDAVRRAATDMGYRHRDVISGAGHDACNLASVAPTGMIFVPCDQGISHNERESATPEHVAAGANVLLQAMLAVADRPGPDGG